MTALEAYVRQNEGRNRTISSVEQERSAAGDLSGAQSWIAAEFHDNELR
jgi:hypothetical protein